MAKFNILSINKMTAGERRGLIDMTISLDYEIANILLLDKTNNNGIEDAGLSVAKMQEAKTEYISDFKPNDVKNPLAQEVSSTSLVLQEDQKKWLSSTTMPACIQLTTQKWLEAQNNKELLEKFNSKTINAHVIYEYEKIVGENSKTLLQSDTTLSSILMPLNDLIDVCIKSQFKKNALNYNIPGNLISQSGIVEANQNIDIYISIDDYPVDFCQCNNGGFMLTQPTAMQPYMLHLKYSNGELIDYQHGFQLSQEPIRTKLYAQPNEIYQNASSYKEALSAHGQRYNTQDRALELFELSSTDVTGVLYSYIVGLDQQRSSGNTDNPTIYCNGDIYGSFEMTKSMYSPLYTMEMSADGQQQTMLQCRTYCGIQDSQKKLLLKYYDDVDYSFTRVPGKIIASKHDRTSEGQQKLYPYQKVEYVFPNKAASPAKHKSNLFSIKVSDSGLDDDTMRFSNTNKQLADQVKRDLFNGMKALADSIAPANTQLFKAYYI